MYEELLEQPELEGCKLYLALASVGTIAARIQGQVSIT
jgi:hypothetical protein